ncbi:MAG: type 4a pilus biogenesis protein PilO [bacterium]
MNLIKSKNNYIEKICFLTSAFFILSCLIFYFLIYLPKTNIEKLKNNILSQKINHEKTINKQYNMAGLQSKLQKMEPDMERLNNIFINKNINNGIDFIEKMDNLEKQNYVNVILNINTGASKSNEIYKAIPMTISVTGAYENIIGYLTSLEKLNYYISINSFSIRRMTEKDGDAPSGTPNIVLNVNADTYWK